MKSERLLKKYILKLPGELKEKSSLWDKAVLLPDRPQGSADGWQRPSQGADTHKYTRHHDHPGLQGKKRRSEVTFENSDLLLVVMF